MSDCPLFLVDCKKIDTTPDSDSTCKVTGDHAIACGIEFDEHDWVCMRFSFFFGSFGILIPDSDAS